MSNAWFNRYPTSGNTTIPNALTTLVTINQQWLHGQEGWGGYLIHLMNTGARDCTDLTFRLCIDGTNYDNYFAITDAVADKIAAKLTAGSHVTLLLAMPVGSLQIKARTGFADGAMYVKYARFDFPFDKMRINGTPIDEFIADTGFIATGVVNGSNLAVDNTDAVTYAIPAGTKKWKVMVTGDEDVIMAYGQNTAAGTRGMPLARCADDGMGGLVLGTGGEHVESDVLSGTVYFYCAGTSTVRIIKLA